MKIAILSDIHANLTALEAVLADVERADALDGMWVAGDTVGYGPDPNECVRAVHDRASLVVAGNHELAALGRQSTGEFNPYAAAAIEWTAEVLTRDSIEYLSALPLRLEQGGFTIVHGSPRDPVWEYVVTAEAVLGNLDEFATPGCVVGHSHVPFVVKVGGGEIAVTEGTRDAVVRLDSDRCYVNPGSVGQPRDGDARAAYAVYDDESATVMFRRVEYDIAATQHRMEAAGLPMPLISRLAFGR